MNKGNKEMYLSYLQKGSLQLIRVDTTNDFVIYPLTLVSQPLKRRWYNYHVGVPAASIINCSFPYPFMCLIM